MTDYFLCGWRVRSAMPLPELIAWDGDDRLPDVEFMRDAVPWGLDTAGPVRVMTWGAGEIGVSVHVAADATVLLDVAGVGRFLVVDGRRVIVEPVYPVDYPAIRLYLLGSVLAMLSYQRGFLPLHASCLATDAGAIAIAGESGAGKSTLAATFALNGVPLLADDVCVVDTAAPDGPLAWPSVARLRLWRDAADRLGIPISNLEPVRRGVEKYAWCGITAFRTDPVPLAAIYHLTRAGNALVELDLDRFGESPVAMSGLAAVHALYGSVYRCEIGTAMGQSQQIGKALMAILAAVPVYRVSHDPGNSGQQPLVQRLLEHGPTWAGR